MAKKLSEAINKEIIDFTVCLTEVGLEISNNYPSTKQMLKKINDKRKKGKSISKTITKITPAVADENHKVIFDNELEYIDLYKELEKDKNYNVKLVDGALISLTYEIDEQDKKILTHRLTFFLPHLCLHLRTIEQLMKVMDMRNYILISLAKIYIHFQ